MKTTRTSDRVLAGLALSGSRSAFEELFERHFLRIHAWAGLRAPSVADAERVTSCALEHAFAELARVASGEDLGLRAMRAAWAVLGTNRVHTTATESPR